MKEYIIRLSVENQRRKRTYQFKYNSNDLEQIDEAFILYCIAEHNARIDFDNYKSKQSYTRIIEDCIRETDF